MSVGGVPRQSSWPLEDSQRQQDRLWVRPELRAEQGVLPALKPTSFPAGAGALRPSAPGAWSCGLSPSFSRPIRGGAGSLYPQPPLSPLLPIPALPAILSCWQRQR